MKGTCSTSVLSLWPHKLTYVLATVINAALNIRVIYFSNEYFHMLGIYDYYFLDHIFPFFIYLFNFFLLLFAFSVMGRGDTHLDVILVVMFAVPGHRFLVCGAYQGSHSLLLTYTWPPCARDHIFHSFHCGMENSNGRLWTVCLARGARATLGL